LAEEGYSDALRTLHRLYAFHPVVVDESLSGTMKDLEKVESYINYEKRQTDA